MLKIDLLPKSFAIARFNRLMLVVLLVVLGLAAGAWMLYAAQVQRQIDGVAQSITKVKPDADKYTDTMSKISAKQAELKPIDDKVKFIDQANQSGLIYWDQYDKVRRYIYPRARLLNFTVSPPNACSFSVTVRGTTEYARFLLDLLRCPYFTITSFTPLGAGRSVPSAAEPEPGQWPTGRGKTTMGGAPRPGAPAGPAAPGGVPGMGLVGPRAGGGMPGAPPGVGPSGPGGAPPGAPSAMPAGPVPPGGGAPGMGGGMPGGTPGGMPGMGGAPGAGGGGGGSTSPDKQDITISVTGTLGVTISTPMPPGMAAPAGAGGMPGGMPGGMGGMPGMGGAPGGGPGMAGSGGASKGGAAGGPGAGKKGGGEDDSGDSGLGKRKGGGGED